MRLFSFAGLFLTAMSSFAATAGQTDFFLYVGSYTNEIQLYGFNAATGQLKAIGAAGEVASPSWIAADAAFRHLYAVSEVNGKEGGVAAFTLNRETGALKKLNEVRSGGTAPCHLVTDRAGKLVIVANYSTGGVSAYPIKADGSLGEMSSLMTAAGHGPDQQRQEGPHAHEVVLSADNKLAYVPDLGLDQIRVYRVDAATAKLTPAEPPFIKQDAGFGPRHLAFSPDRSFAYLMNELKSEVSVFKHDSATGSLTKIQDVSSLPADYSGENAPAEILVSSTGKFVYATNRGADTIAVFAVEPGKGTIRLTQTVSSQGAMPRGLTIDPTGKFMFVGNQNGNNFAVYHINADNGQLTPTGQVIHQGTPVAFLFVPKS
jgi:6-phosphogluconolactonase